MPERQKAADFTDRQKTAFDWCHSLYREKLLQHPPTFSELTLCPGKVHHLPLANKMDDLLTLAYLVSEGVTVEVISPEGPVPPLPVPIGPITKIHEGQVLIRTSGSDGAAKCIARPLTSLIEEAERYINSLSLTKEDHIALIAPICHAYALGFAMAGLVCGAKISLCPPTYLTQAAELITAGQATWVVLTPTIARLLADRPLKTPLPPAYASLTVMAGAGPVTAELEQKFKKRFGVGLARNYGSSETGAVFCGPENLADFCVGAAMKGVEYRLRDPKGKLLPADQQAILHIKTREGWHNMNDLVKLDPSGHMTLYGRLSRSLRRGECWISSLEIENAARQYDGILEAAIRKSCAPETLTDKMTLDLWVNNPRHFDLDLFKAFLFDRLGPQKMPDEIFLRHGLKYSASGKAQATARYRVGPSEILLKTARSHKKSSLLFALLHTGLLDSLDGHRSNHDLARLLELDLTSVDFLLSCAEDYGFVTSTNGPRATQNTNSDVVMLREILSLENMVRDHLVTPESLQQILTQGLDHTPPVPRDFGEIYSAAMQGKMGRIRALRGARCLSVKAKGRYLEISSGPGHYLSALRDRQPGITTELRQMDQPIEGGLYDGIILCNVIHQEHAEKTLHHLVPHLTPGARILIDDIFLCEANPMTSADYALDWLTHGGLGFMKLGELTTRLETMGLDTTVHTPDNTHNIHIITAHQP